MATVKFILNRYRVLKNGAYPLVFQLIHRRQKKLIYTSYKLLEDEFDSRKQDVRFISKAVRSNKREVGKLNRELRQIQGDLDNYIATLEARRKPYTVSDIVMRSHLRTWHRELILERRGCTQMGQAWDIPLSATKRYLRSTAQKYAPAIKRLKEGGLSTAAVAAEFGLNPETFRKYLHEHEPELSATLGMTRLENGRTALRRSTEKYAEAVRLRKPHVQLWVEIQQPGQTKKYTEDCTTYRNVLNKA